LDRWLNGLAAQQVIRMRQRVDSAHGARKAKDTVEHMWVVPLAVRVVNTQLDQGIQVSPEG
jgi:hypothetical protein